MPMPHVSVVIPAYNQARFLRTAVESVLDEPRDDVEVIVVDDGSTDDTPTIATALAARDGRVRLVRQPNAGVAAARNAGLRLASGRHVCFLDADDALLAGGMAAHCAVLDGDPAVAFTYGDALLVDEEDRRLPETYSVGRARTILSGDILPSLLLGGYFPPASVMVRRDVLDRIGGFEPALGGHADYDLWLRIVAGGGRAVYLGAPVARYRRHPAGMSRDVEHMRATRTAALERLFRTHPSGAARSVAAMQDTMGAFAAANAELRAAWDRLQQAEWLRERGQVFDLTKEFDAARRTVRTPDAAARWNVTMHGEWGEVIFLHPTARLDYDVPTGASGLVCGAFGLHPAVWDNAEARPVRFHLEVDGGTRFESVIDPSVPAHRCWHSFEVPVASVDGDTHSLALATTVVDRPTFCWALWRSVRFLWR